uniref:Fibronectin type-III domain-containing protein n=1 Tax=Anopheles christyi TaxID=43041 RepID=A0A182KF74_9DIPT
AQKAKKPSTTTAAPNEKEFKHAPEDLGPKPGQPRNVTVVEIPNGFLISWQVPLERAHLVQFYTIKYRTDAQWKTLNRGQIRPEETSYLVKNLVGGRTYYFRVLANSLKSYETSEEIKFPVPARVKHKAITAGVVGGILFFIVAIILSICAVKICNKRKRRKQEKELNMVTARLTDRNALSQPIPLKRYMQGERKASRMPGLNILIAILHWIWPPGRCQNCDSIYSSKFIGDQSMNVGQIHRSADGRFVLSQDLVDGIVSLRNSIVSQYSSSDDGGFLPKRLPSLTKTSWRKPLISYPSQLSLQMETTFGNHHHGGGIVGVGASTVPQLAQPQQSLYTNTMPENTVMVSSISSTLPPLLAQTIYTTPSRISKVVASSPATSSPQVVNSPWSPLYFSDLSSVHHLSSAERSFPTPQSVHSVHRYYKHELPVLQSLQHMSSNHHHHHHHHHHSTHGFIPVSDVPVSLPYYYDQPGVQQLSTSLQEPNQQNVYQNIPWSYYSTSGAPAAGTYPHSNRSKLLSRYYPRSIPRNLSRAIPELRSPMLNLNLNTTSLSAGGGLENSPQSYSSSSGFGSKNTSSNNTQPSGASSAAITTTASNHNLLREWRYLPPYRPPPPPPSLHHAAPLSIGGGRFENPPYSMSHWLELITRLNIASEKANINNTADVGSVDGHYEFDPSTPTPTASTPTGLIRDDFHHLMTLPSTSSDLLWSATGLTGVVSSLSGGRKRGQSRYDNIDARVQAMKEEFYEYRKRQQLQAVNGTSTVELESAC